MTTQKLTVARLINTDRLQDIYDLRVDAYEGSPKAPHVNRQLFPNGWKDQLDEKEQTFHFIVEDGPRIIAAARIAVVDYIKDLEDLPKEAENYKIPNEGPIAYYSRLVVHPSYRKTGLVGALDEVRMNFLKKLPHVKAAIAWATPDRHQALLDLGFTILGDINYKWGGNHATHLKLSFFCHFLPFKN